jgi:hypothetical protein
MASRASDWWRQAQRDLAHARNALEDGDLVVIIRESQDEPVERAALFRAPRIGLPVDLTVYTEAELSRFLTEELPFLKRALTEGRWLATASGWEHPSPSASKTTN